MKHKRFATNLRVGVYNVKLFIYDCQMISDLSFNILDTMQSEQTRTRKKFKFKKVV